MISLLARALKQEERVTIVGSAMFGPKTFPAASSPTPDLVVMNEHFAGVDCTEVTRRLKQLPNPPTVFLVSSGHRAESQSRSLAQARTQCSLTLQIFPANFGPHSKRSSLTPEQQDRNPDEYHDLVER